MARKIFSGILIALSAIFLVMSAAGIGVVWYYNEPLTLQATSQLKQVDKELAQAQTVLASSKKELERALSIVDSAEASLAKLTQQSENAENPFESIQSSLDDRLRPELKQTRSRIENARTNLENLQSLLADIRSLVPIIDLSGLDNSLTDLIASARALDTEIANVEALAKQASTFVSDTSHLLGGDLTQTRESLQSFLTSIETYEKKMAGWREQGQRLLAGIPKWIDQASIALTIFLVWFALSQFGLLLHGFSLRAGDNPLWALRRSARDERVPAEEDIDLEL